MPSSKFDRNFLIVVAIIVAFILYGSLYPFAFRVPLNGMGPLRTFLGTWQTPPGRGDFISNILLYFPLGLFGSRVIQSNRWTSFLVIILVGAILSMSVELMQYYDESRDTELSDTYANTLGTVLGGLVGTLFRGKLRWPFAIEIAANPIPTILLAAWAAYRLYPSVPIIDLHKYWDALKPLVLNPGLHPIHFFHHFAIWLSAAVLIEAIVGVRLAGWMFPVFVAGVIFSEILIISTLLSIDELTGAGSAYVAFLLLLGLRARQRALLVSLVLAVAVLAERLEPFRFGGATRSFGWIPFYSFMNGSVDVDVMSFFEKFYFYGTLIWLLVKAGLRLRLAAALVAAGLFASSLAEIYLPDRSAEITDALMALLIATIFARVKPEDASSP